MQKRRVWSSCGCGSALAASSEEGCWSIQEEGSSIRDAFVAEGAAAAARKGWITTMERTAGF
eukprot:3996853-Amphidinium_carterae.1